MSQAKKVILSGGRVVTPVGVVSANVEIGGGRILRVGDFPAQSGPETRVAQLDGAYVLPGLIDMHINDGVSIIRGLKTPEQHAERLAAVSRGLLPLGITGVFMATLASPLDELEAYLAGMDMFRERWSREPDGAELCGALIEGTFMNPENHGAQNPDYMFAPSREVLDRLLAHPCVRMVNVAPEFGDLSLELIAWIASCGAIPAAGHCKPTAAQLAQAADRGLKYIIHMYNGPTGSSTKSFDGGGMLEGALRDDRITAEMIGDLVHVHPAVLRDAIARKGVGRVVAVSDVMFPVDAPAGGFEINGILGRADEKGEYLYVTGRRGADGGVTEVKSGEIRASNVKVLFGAAVNQDRVFANMVGLLASEVEGNYIRRHSALPLDEAVCHASRMCSENPARLTGLYDGSAGRKVGAVAAGYEADIIVADIARGEGLRAEVQLREVFLAGKPALGLCN